MYHTINEFIRDWQGESAKTARVLEGLTDASLAQAIVPGDRTIGWTAWHIAQTIVEMPVAAGLELHAFDAHAPEPKRAGEIAEHYRDAARALAAAMDAQWTDAMLKDELDIYGMKWTRALTLEIFMRHEIHHRAQLLILMRQAGLKVPSVYGPSRDDLGVGEVAKA
jgi:uncharacterized damage-inducible protein DinB